jgi:ABC-type polysaccharide/polyol phosphate transport system ATPase subunit
MADDGCRTARPQRRSPPPPMKPSIEVEGLSKTYRIYGNPWGPLFEKLPWNKKPWHKAVHALHDINFKVEPSQCVGLIGSNGAGTSTLLKISMNSGCHQISGFTFLPATAPVFVR